MQVFTERRQTSQEVTRTTYEALVAQRSELQQQLTQFTERRNLLYAQSRRTEGAQLQELNSRMAEIDARSSRLDAQISALNDQIAQAIGRGIPSAAPTPVPGEIRIPQISVPSIGFGQTTRTRDLERVMIGGLVTEGIVLVLIGFFAWRVGMKRMRDQFERMLGAQTSQLDQLQQAVDTVAVEVERISEGQRYVAKVLAEGSPATALAGGRKEPVPASRQG